jgi:RimJ/RimL family protein N-acetyltransferase
MPYPLLTERLSIRPLALTDVGSFVAYRQDPVIARFQGWEPTFSAEDARTLIESQAGVSIPDKGEWLQLAIHDRVSGELVGDLALHSAKEGDGVLEIGFTISPAFQSQGFAHEAASRLMKYLFADVGVTKFVAKTDNRNTASIKVLLALEFVRNPSRSLTEDFKNEQVTMDYFEIH